jgi:hypothetical protein
MLRSDLKSFVFVLGCAWVLGACADTTTQVRSRAARDMSCGEKETRVVDGEGGVYRVLGCGLEASYVCSEDRTLSTHCKRIYMSKSEQSAAPKASPSSSLAKRP